jgi:hypothetical protein
MKTMDEIVPKPRRLPDALCTRHARPWAGTEGSL